MHDDLAHAAVFTAHDVLGHDAVRRVALDGHVVLGDRLATDKTRSGNGEGKGNGLHLHEVLL